MLLSKGTPNIYLKVTTEKNWPSQNLDFVSLKNLSPGQFFGSFNSRRLSLNFKIFVAT